MISSLSIFSLCSRWMALVARKTWIRACSACRTASQARSMSASRQRARPQITEPRTLRAISRTASKSPGEAMGKPASITSTPSSTSAWATSIFSARFMLAPGDCSPSRSVVSKQRAKPQMTEPRTLRAISHRPRSRPAMRSGIPLRSRPHPARPRLGDFHFLGQIHAGAGRLFAVAERGVEDDDVSGSGRDCICH